jgi:hypothetical protein
MGIVPIAAVDQRARIALSTAWSMMSAARLLAVHVCDGTGSACDVRQRWKRWEPGVPLVVLARRPGDGDPVAVSIADYLSRRHTAYQISVVITEDRAGRHPVTPHRGPSRSDALEAALLPLDHVVVCRQRPIVRTTRTAPPRGGFRH